MACPLSIVSAVVPLVWNSLRLLADIFAFFRLCLRSRAAVAAENLFLRKQLGLYIERKRNVSPMNCCEGRDSNFSPHDSALYASKTRPACSASNPDSFDVPQAFAVSQLREGIDRYWSQQRNYDNDDRCRNGPHIFEILCEVDGRSAPRTRTGQHASAIVG